MLRVGAHVAHRLGEALAGEGREIVLPGRLREGVPLERRDHGGHDLASVDPAIGVEARRLHPFFQHAAELERDRGAAGADDEAPEPARMQRRGEERRAGADVGPHDVWLLQAERVGGSNDEFPHRFWGHQRIAVLGLPEPREIDRHQMGVLCQPGPGGLVAVNALRPGAQQERVVVPWLALGVANGQTVNAADTRLDRLAQRCGHELVPHCWWSGGNQLAALHRVMLDTPGEERRLLPV
jgi:hypothetical protein